MRIWLFIFVLLSTCSWAGDLRVGRAEIDITPPPGIPMGGYFYVRVNTGVHDPLHAKALVLDSDGVKVALVACDLESLPHRFVAAAEDLILRDTGIAPDQVIISATHTHTGPEMDHVMLAEIEGPPAQVAKEYDSALPVKIAESVRRAAFDLTPARASAADGMEPSLVFNRRFFMKDGSVVFNPGKMNPDIVRPAGPTDPSVPVIYFESSQGQPLATYVNYALHLDTIGGTEFSADYPYFLGKELSEVKGSAMLTFFTIGTAGNINHLDVNNPDPQNGVAESGRIGTILAAEVLKAYKHLRPVASGFLRVNQEIVELPVQDLKAGEVGAAREAAAWVRKPLGAGGPEFLPMVHAFKVLHVADYHGKAVLASVQVISLGNDVAWVGLPGEIFVELGMAIKHASPFPYTVVSELSGDSIDYIPDRKGFAEGAYEATTARCKPGSGEVLVDAATRLLLKAYRFGNAH